MTRVSARSRRRGETSNRDPAARAADADGPRRGVVDHESNVRRDGGEPPGGRVEDQRGADQLQRAGRDRQRRGHDARIGDRRVQRQAGDGAERRARDEERSAGGQPAADRCRGAPGGGNHRDAGHDAGQQQRIPRSHRRRQRVADREPRRIVAGARTRQHQPLHRQRQLSGGEQRPRARAGGVPLSQRGGEDGGHRPGAGEQRREREHRQVPDALRIEGRHGPEAEGVTGGQPIRLRDDRCRHQKRRGGDDRAIRSDSSDRRPRHRRRMVQPASVKTTCLREYYDRPGPNRFGRDGRSAAGQNFTRLPGSARSAEPVGGARTIRRGDSFSTPAVMMPASQPIS